MELKPSEQVEALFARDQGLEYEAHYSLYVNQTGYLSNSTFYQKVDNSYLVVQGIFFNKTAHLFILGNETFVCEETKENITCYVPPQPIIYQTVLLFGHPAALLKDEINREGIEGVFAEDDNYTFYQETHAGVVSDCFHVDMKLGPYSSSKMLECCFAPDGVVTYFNRESIRGGFVSQELTSLSYAVVPDDVFNLPVAPTPYVQPSP